jgi:hypothetical protein
MIEWRTGFDVHGALAWGFGGEVSDHDYLESYILPAR